ncbi:type II toxin-antitoxin system VapC family toxin [soil metagenome]
MHYFDTSFIAPLFLAEDRSKYVETIIRTIENDHMVSQWLRVEFASLIARNVRMKIFTELQAVEMMNQFEPLIRSSFYIVVPTVADFNLASSFIQKFDSGLRAGDALHLAIAHNQKIDKFYTLDQGLAAAARKLTSFSVIT